MEAEKAALQAAGKYYREGEGPPLEELEVRHPALSCGSPRGRMREHLRLDKLVPLSMKHRLARETIKSFR